MAYMVDQQTNFKYFCKICKKGFGCGRALGGHMRAHGIGYESGHMDDDDDRASEWEDKLGEGPSNRRMYALRTNPNRLKSCRVCENCGKEFLSWKSFLEHGKCTSEDAESLVSSPTASDGEDDVARRGVGWSKRKRSLRLKVGNFNSHCPPNEEEDLANCLMMLSNASRTDALLAEPEKSCGSASRDDQERRNRPLDKAKGLARGLFECKACKKVFNSHQALGGHRASHKKVKGCFAARLDRESTSLGDDDVMITHEEFLLPSKSTSTLQHYEHGPTTTSLVASKRKSKVHECSICHRIFSSGQALGGHKRCHWITSNAPETSSSLAKFHDHQISEQVHQNPKFAKSEALDLNLPANELGKVRRDPQNPLSFEVSTDILLQSWTGVDSKEKDENDHCQNNNHHHNNNNNNNSNGSMQNVDDEAQSKAKLAKMSDLKDMNISGGSSSPWLQVGIGSTINLGAES